MSRFDTGGVAPAQEGHADLYPPSCCASGQVMEQSTRAPIFELIVWSGAGFALLGLIGLIWCIITVWRARQAQLPDDEMRAVMARVLPRNLGALFISVLGLMLVVVGVFLG